jgi:hypothetical protein
MKYYWVSIFEDTKHSYELSEWFVVAENEKEVYKQFPVKKEYLKLEEIPPKPHKECIYNSP